MGKEVSIKNIVKEKSCRPEGIRVGTEKGETLFHRPDPILNLSGGIRLQPHDLNETMLKLRDRLTFLKGRDIKVEFKPAEYEIMVMADASRLEEAFLGLIRNAGDAMTSGGILTLCTGQVHFSNGTYPVDGAYEHLYSSCALFSVSDTGKGMDGETKRLAFKPFFTTEPGRNTGLGLTLASAIIRSHVGSVNIESEPGKGTKVEVYLPLISESLKVSASISRSLKCERPVSAAGHTN
ncbi:MAG TPA: ATP-binding protein [Syntrophorhabdaceae bacterium]|jgi:signal transduction histidine kinase